MRLKTRAANKISAWRTYRGYTQAELGQKIGVTAASIRAWESGAVVPTATHLAMLCSALRCRLSDIYPGVTRTVTH